ncbi:glycosyltransferase [Rapidithrix thailandica]|uniref:Glycosyltransferase n=1 Tax=Rapidithrix thailandica TaxID=413964 RepID=A0AAW9SF60_9BACT
MNNSDINKRVCVLFNYPSHYREEVLVKIQKELNADIYFGSATFAKIKKMSFNSFKEEPKTLKFIKLFSYFNWIKGSVSLLRKYKTFIIYGELYCISTWVILIISNIINKDLYLWSHGFYGRESNVKKKIKSIFFRLSKGVFVYGDYSKKLMIESGVPKEKIHVINNSLNHSKILKAREKSTKLSSPYQEYFKNTNPMIIYIGRVQKQKKISQLIDALLYCKEELNLNLNMVIVGTGNDIHEIKSYSKKKGIDKHIWFYGPSYDEEINGNLIFNADVCVSPGEIGLTAIHALSYGTPVITHNNFPYQGPEFEAIKNGVTGLFFNVNDHISLASQLAKWLSLHPTKSQQLIKECQLVVDKSYNPDFQVKLLKEVIFK